MIEINDKVIAIVKMRACWKDILEKELIGAVGWWIKGKF